MSTTFEYKKISQLPSASNITDTDILVINANGKTSKITLTTLVNFIKDKIGTSALETKVSGIETSVNTLSTSVSANSEAIDNIIAAGFNLIGVDE